MNNIRKIFLCISLLISCSFAYAESSYDISELYSVEKPASGTKAVGKYDKLVEVEYILSPTSDRRAFSFSFSSASHFLCAPALIKELKNRS